jgi:hypothetical protein
VSEAVVPPADVGEDMRKWLRPGVAGIGAASLLAEVGHEVPTALLPSLVTSPLRAPAAALGVIEGISDGLARLARLAGDALATTSAARSVTASRPPGTSTRHASASTRGLSTDRLSTQLEITTSALPSSTGRSSMYP